MSIGNIHGLVRGAIGSVNPDISGQWIVSTGTSIALGGKSTPAYAAASPVTLQVQAVSGSDLRKYNFLQGNGVYRAVYMYSNPDAINRNASKGGDLVLFPQYPRGPVCTWLVSKIDEPWTAGNGNLSWCRVIVTLQLDPFNPASQV
jgi:hypothetical protein